MRELAAPLARCVVAAPEDDLVEVLDHATAPPPILVMEDGRLVGIVTVDNIDRAARSRLPAANRST